LSSPQGTVVVTGGGSGIGAAVAGALHRAGFDTVAADVAPGDGVVALDVRDEAGWETVMAGIDRLAGVVNCAGIRSHTSLEEMTLDAWRQVVDTNLTGTFLGTRAALRRCRAQGSGGVVVNMASVAAFVPTPHQAHYVATKGGIVAFTKAAALEGGPLGVRVNALAPGPILTPLIAQGMGDPDVLARVEGRIPLGRIGQVADVTGVVTFLFSEAAAYLTGATIPVDGGWLSQGPV
jgi:NAD(P)-dependent dehydrogenase (short-subunit alcohol dehydrogenase family)